jgi:hypothetical protein
LTSLIGVRSILRDYAAQVVDANGQRLAVTALGVTHFVDDRAEVLAALAGIVPHLYLFGPQTSPSDVNALSVLTWAETEREIAESLYEWPKNDGTEARSD